MDARQQEYYNQIKTVVESKGGRVISPYYVKMINKMVFQCQDGHTWDTEARSILKGMWCRYCHGNTREQGEIAFYRRVADKGGKALTKYTGNHNYVSVQCGDCEAIWNILPYNLCADKWCPVCAYKDHGGGATRFLQTLEDRGGKLVGEYINGKTKTLVDCGKGHTWMVKPYSIVVDTWCPHCWQSSGGGASRFLQTLEDRGGKIIGEYMGGRIKTLVDCGKGHTWMAKPYSVVAGTWCPHCLQSSGESMIIHYLTEKGIAYKEQFILTELLPRKKYDFFIEYKDERIIIEYDGKMHFKYIPYYHVTENFFQHRQRVDVAKAAIALQNGYKMIRIDDWEVLRIREHLDRALAQLDVLYLASPKLYEGWFLGRTLSPEEFADAFQGRTRPKLEEESNEDVTEPLEQVKVNKPLIKLIIKT